MAILEPYLVVNESSILKSSSATGQVSLEMRVNLSGVFIHQIERISGELGTSSHFALHQEGVVRA